ncbi:MAG: DUF421 domain-containing protein [Actinobacteria bacterium]|nr:DUF421 domain-containing protein [Actinomycetota bacterium]
MEWLVTASWGDIGQVALSGVLIYGAVIAANRINGLRTFAKMSGYDFAATVAIGSIVASVTLSVSTPVSSGVVAVITVVGGQRVLTVLRRRSAVKRLVDNAPMLLVHDGQVLADGLRRTGIAPDDVREKVRAAGAGSMREVAAVVLETSGDVSVIVGDAGQLDPELFAGIRGSDLLSGRG